ncbi:protein-tyrosine phosphatase-like protein, partial [Lactarius hengduanensis]
MAVIRSLAHSQREHAPTFPQTHPRLTLHIPLSDSSDQDILAHLPTTTPFIRDALAESPDSRVMVHCLMGISRSATVVCAYLVATARVTPHEALMAVKGNVNREPQNRVSVAIGSRRGDENHYAKLFLPFLFLKICFHGIHAINNGQSRDILRISWEARPPDRNQIPESEHSKAIGPQSKQRLHRQCADVIPLHTIGDPPQVPQCAPIVFVATFDSKSSSDSAQITKTQR